MIQVRATLSLALRAPSFVLRARGLGSNGLKENLNENIQCRVCTKNSHRVIFGILQISVLGAPYSLGTRVNVNLQNNDLCYHTQPVFEECEKNQRSITELKDHSR